MLEKAKPTSPSSAVSLVNDDETEVAATEDHKC